jgi:AcrR family transcriptional regulator
VETSARTRNPRGRGGRLHDEIVTAAITLIDAANDPAALTLRGVARQAGVTAPSIYPHFPDLAAVVAALLARSFEELRAAVETALGRQEDGNQEPGSQETGTQEPGDQERAPARALVAAGLAYVRFAWEHPARYRLMFAAGGYAPDAVDTFALVEGAIRRCVAAGDSASDDPRADTWLLWAALHGVATLEKPVRSDYLRLGPLDRPALLETLIRRIVRLT